MRESILYNRSISVRKVDGATHFLPLTDPDDYVGVVGGWVATMR